MYTIIFITGEAVNNAAGLGFNGYDDKGNAKWDLLNNVKIYELEVCIVRNFEKCHSFPVYKMIKIKLVHNAVLIVLI